MKMKIKMLRQNTPELDSEHSLSELPVSSMFIYIFPVIPQHSIIMSISDCMFFTFLLMLYLTIMIIHVKYMFRQLYFQRFT